MLYPTLNQPLIFLLTILVGLASGVIFDICKILCLLSGGDKYSRHIFDFLAVAVSFALLFICNLKFNLGQFRLYVVVAFLISFSVQRIFSKFLWTKVKEKCYNIFAKLKKGKNEKREGS
jgi:hypothetical protein